MLRTAQDSVHLVAATIGFVSYAALWGGTLWGTVLRSGWATSRLRHQTVYSVHMHVILLGLTLGIVHGIVQMVAPYGKVRAIDVVVPFIDRADPIGVGLGVLALELMIATALSVLIQRKLGYARWRALHSLGYTGVGDVRQGKFFELELDAATADQAQKLASEVADKVLANPVIESYRVEVE